MESMKEKFKKVVSHYRITANHKWHEVCSRDFIIALTPIEKKEIENFYNWLLAKGILTDIEGELYLTDSGETFVYGNNNDPTLKILKELNRLNMCEGYCWQFGSYNSFKSNLNPVEEKNFYFAIEQMIKEGLLIRNGFDNMLVLTKLGEDKLKKTFY